jgi:hypothetical protein
LNKLACCLPLRIISPELTLANKLSPCKEEPPIIPPSANLPANEANNAVIVATILAIAAILAGNGNAAPEAVPAASASPSLAPIKATICGIIYATA